MQGLGNEGAGVPTPFPCTVPEVSTVREVLSAPAHFPLRAALRTFFLSLPGGGEKPSLKPFIKPFAGQANPSATKIKGTHRRDSSAQNKL